MSIKGLTVSEAQKKLEYYCAYQERCHLEVRTKLDNLGIIPTAQELIITHLIEENYLNETRFAQSFARGKFRVKKWGKNRIVRELKLRQISSYNIKIALQEIAEKFWQTNAHRSPILRKKKVMDALRYRGWENNLIYETVTTLENNLNSK